MHMEKMVTPNITTKCQLVSFSLLEYNCLPALLPAFLPFLLHLSHSYIIHVFSYLLGSYKLPGAVLDTGI